MFSSNEQMEQAFAVRLMEHLVTPTFVLGADGQVIIWNKACERLTGIAATDVVGTRDHWRAFYEEPRQCLADLVWKGRATDIATLYAEHIQGSEAQLGIHAENWCNMPVLRRAFISASTPARSSTRTAS